MRFSELHLIRYGRFDGCRLSFPQAGSDLHVVYGPNEAGKSTTMSAVADLLFGFPHVASHDFRFDKLLLRVGGIVEGAGASLLVRRKRGRVGSLMDADERPIDEERLSAQLVGQTRESFLRAFSLDHGRLREGGQSMLEAKDDVGQAIFAAGAGLVGVTRLAEALDEEAKAIWSERASANRLYYVAQKAHDEAKSRLRDHQLKSAHWNELKRSVDTHEAALDALRQQRSAVRTALQATERRRRVLAPAARYDHLLQQLSKMGDVPELPPDAAQVLAAASREIVESGATERLALEQAAIARDQLAAIVVDEPLLARRARLAGLRGQQGAVEKALRDTPGLKAKAAGADAQLSRLLREVGWSQTVASEVQARLPGRPAVAELRALADEYSGLETARLSALADVAEQDRLAQDVQRALVSLAPPAVGDAFSVALQDVRSQGDLDLSARTAAGRRDRAVAALDAALDELAPWRGPAEDLAALQIASEAETYRLAEALGAAEEEAAAAQAAVTSLRDAQAHKELRRAQLLRHEHAVSWSMLDGARRTRDASWSRLSAHLGGVAQDATPTALGEQFERQLRDADALADRRFDAADTSGALLRLDEDLERTALDIGQALARGEAAQGGLVAAETAWREATAIIGPGVSPDGVKIWRVNRRRALELAHAAKVEAEEATRQQAALDDARERLCAAMPAASADDLGGATLARVLQRAVELEDGVRARRDQHAVLQVRLAAAEEASRRAEVRRDEVLRRLERWKARWSEALTLAGLATTGSLSLVRARLDLLDDIRAVAEKILGFEERIEDIGRDVQAFTKEVGDLARTVGVDEDGEAADVLSVLERRLDAAVTLGERAAGLKAQITSAEGRAATARERAILAHEALAPLLAAAMTREPAELAATIEQVELARAMRGELGELARSILELGDGLALPDLLAEAADVDSASLADQGERLREQLNDLSGEIERLAELRQAADLQFKAADDRPDAAIAAADLAQARAEMEAQAEAYVRKRAEASLLRWTVERYRREKQAPLLRRASTIFSELTVGRYEALGVDVEGSRPRLSGILADHATVVPVSGMSEGTVDQLFLSLRLAAVEESVAAGVKLPFLADDLFINYDDARSAAGLEVLARLAEQTQVLFFTHHEHLADLAREVLEGRVSTCRLGDLGMEAV